MKESNLSKSWLPVWQEENPGGRLFRNNCGVGWVGELAEKNIVLNYLKKTGKKSVEINGKKTTKNGLVVKLFFARIIKFGIGLKNKKGHPVGGGDFIGWTEKTLCKILKQYNNCIKTAYTENCNKSCPWTKKIAVFTNIEFKTKNVKESKEQIKFRKLVIDSGGISEVIKEGE